MKFRATIRKEGGTTEERVIEAPTRFAVYDLVRKENGTVLALAESARLSFRLKDLNITFGTGVKRVDIITMAKNLSAMLTAGLSLSRALSVIERQSSSERLKSVVAEVSVTISKGSSLHSALAEHPKIFPKLLIAMVKAGEESGGLSGALSTVALQMERSEELSRKIKGAMIYPSIVIIAILIVTVLMLIFVVPTLSATFTQLHVKLPLATSIIIRLSSFMTNNVLLVVPALILIVIGVIAALRSRIGLQVTLFCALRLPAVGTLVREAYAARAARTLSSLLAAGVPILTALSITEEVVAAPLFARVLATANERVKRGEPLSLAFVDRSDLYPLMMSDMIAVGEETGKLAEMLQQIAEFYEEDVAQKTKDLSTIIEPVLMLLIGAVVGVFAVSMIAPIYSLGSAI